MLLLLLLVLLAVRQCVMCRRRKMHGERKALENVYAQMDD